MLAKEAEEMTDDAGIATQSDVRSGARESDLLKSNCKGGW